MIGPSSRSRGDVVRGRADELDAAVVRLVVGPGALEARQHRVVDVDRPALELPAQVVGEDLHVAGEDHQVDPLRPHDVEQRRLGLRLGLAGDRDVVEGDAVEVGDAREVGVVGDDRDDVEVQLADGVAEEQVVEAVPVLADHDQHALAVGGVGHAPVHLEALRRPPRRPRAARPKSSGEPSTWANWTRMKNMPLSGCRTGGSPRSCSRRRRGARRPRARCRGRPGRTAPGRRAERRRAAS